MNQTNETFDKLIDALTLSDAGARINPNTSEFLLK